MSFKMRCPKCNGLDYSIERDNRTFGAVAQAFELVFHCRCGKQMFGEQILKEYEDQKRAWEADASSRDVEDDVPERRSQREAREQLQQVYEARRQRESGAEVRLAPEPEAPRAAPSPADTPTPAPAKVRENKPKAAVESPRKASASTAKVEVVTAVEQCAWPGCENPARKNSKYCSRACSNKNARHRHKLRAKDDDEEGDEAVD